MNIIWKGSPNKDDPSFRKAIDRVVIHWFGVGTLDSANNRFQNPTAKASAHYGISDGTVYQWVREEDVAWHAGVYAMNQRSIGIEHDATTIKNASEETYKSSGLLLAQICERHNIPLDRTHIIGHKEVSATQCPGTLDIDKIISLAKGGSVSECEIKLADSEKALGEMRESRNKWKTQCAEDAERHAQEIADKNKHIDLMQSTLAEQNVQISSTGKTISALTEENKRLLDDSVTLRQQYVDLTISSGEEMALLDSTVTKLMEENRKLAFKVAELDEKVSEGLKKYTVWELLKAILGR